MSFDNRLLAVKCITLMHLESQLPDQESNSADLVRTVLDSMKLPEIAVSLGGDRNILMALKETALYMCHQPIGTTYEKSELLQRLKINCRDDEKLYEALEQAIDKELDVPSIKRAILSIHKYLKDTFRENEAINLFVKTANDLRYNREKIKNLQHYFQEFATKLEPYQRESTRKDPAIVASVDLGDEQGLGEAFEVIQENAEGKTVLKTGWQGLNRMLQGGFRRGETWTIAALQHNYKTGMSLTLFKQLAIYNTPVLATPGKKPLLLRISFEDSLSSNLQFLYQNIWENENGGETPSLKGLKSADMARYVREHMQVTGYHVRMMRVNPSEWTYKDIQNTVLDYEANGYEVHCLMLDYLPMIPTTGCDQSGGMGSDKLDMVKRMRNFCSSRGILMITPWQMSTDAKMLKREGSTELVKKVKDGGYYKDTKQVDQEVDGELYQHIEHLGGDAYLTMQRGKHRIPTLAAEIDKYIVLPFPKNASIPDDLNKREITLRKVGGGSLDGPDAVPFFEFDDIPKAKPKVYEAPVMSAPKPTDERLKDPGFNQFLDKIVKPTETPKQEEVKAQEALVPELA